MLPFVPSPIRRLVALGAAAGALTGCATTPKPATGAAKDAQVVEGEAVYPTGSRISHVVKKGAPAGIARDQPGAVTNSSNVERDQNDAATQGRLIFGAESRGR